MRLSIHQSVCPQGGYPYPIMLCNISQNAMRQYTPQGGYPGQVHPPGGVPGSGTPPGGYLGQVTPPGGVPGSGTPPRGDTRVGQQKEYSLHGGRYASCVHAGGLSCYNVSFLRTFRLRKFEWFPNTSNNVVWKFIINMNTIFHVKSSSMSILLHYFVILLSPYL